MVESSKILVVGDLYTNEDALHDLPFMSTSGRLLKRLLRNVGIDPELATLTNVFNIAADNPKEGWREFCGPKAEMPHGYKLPGIEPGIFLRPEYFSHLEALHKLIEEKQPNVIILLGNVALWAVAEIAPRISKLRGSVFLDPVHGLKCVCTFHPAKLLHDHRDKTVIMCDLMKAAKESNYPELQLPKRNIYIADELDDLQVFEEMIYGQTMEPLGFDIETKAYKFITSISFSRSADWACVIPITRANCEDYWDHESEVFVVRWLKRILEDRSLPKLAQNGLYDIQWLHRVYKIGTRNYSHDTMLLHHALWPELPKSLGFMGSIHTNEANWKLYKPRNASANKREE